MRTLKLTGYRLAELLILAAAVGFVAPADTAVARKKFGASSSKHSDSGSPNKKDGGDPNATHPDGAHPDGEDGGEFSIKIRPKVRGSGGDDEEKAENSAAASKSAKPDPLDPSVPHVRPSDEPDDFGKRAQEALKAENAVQKPHPLQERYPDHNVVVCEAGCGPGGRVVFKEKKGARQPVDQAEMVTTSDGAEAEADDGVLNLYCAAGCYDSKKVIRSVEVPRSQQTPKPRADGARQDGTKNASNSESGKWLAKINEEASAQKPSAPELAAPATAKSSELAATGSDVTAKAAVEAPAAAAATANAPSEAEAKPAVVAQAKAPEAPAAKPNVSPQAVPVDPATKDASPAAASTPAEVTPKAEVPSKPVDAAQAPAKAEGAPAQKPIELAEAKVAEAAPAPAPAPEAAKPAGDTKAEKPVVVAEANKAAAPVGDKTVSVASDDSEMKSAIAKAKSGLIAFWSSLEKPGAGETDFALKVAITEKDQTEHFWLTNIERKGGKTTGIISNTPTLVTSVTQGQRYTFTDEQISDWLFKRNGKMVGNETMRPLLKRMPKEQAEAYRSLYETP